MKLTRVMTKDAFGPRVDYYEAYEVYKDTILRVRLRKCVQYPKVWYLTGCHGCGSGVFHRCMILHPKTYSDGVVWADEVLLLLRSFVREEVI